ncbi:MAG: DNA repair protein RadA [bacterium]
MAEKLSTMYICSQCDAQFPKWSGRCLECGAWGSLKQATISQTTNSKGVIEAEPAEAISLDQPGDLQVRRMIVNIQEIDRVFGQGIVVGSLTLLGGEPGIGKSTLVAQIANNLNKSILYVSGEESLSQVKLRLERLSCKMDKIKFVSETNIEKVVSAIKAIKPALVIIDSIQTVHSREIASESGSVAQIRACAVKLLEVAKQDNITIIVVGHITKDGSLAGPKSLEHIVDTVLYLETDPSNSYRFLRSTKNRFGSTHEMGVFEMTSQGLKEVKNPTEIFLEQNIKPITGSVISCIMEGTRPFLTEIQALVSKTVFGYPQRKSSGFDLNRLQVLAAVISKRTKVNLTSQDIILNVVGGLKISDPSIDLAICGAVISSHLNKALDQKTIILGEVGLGGEVRPVGNLQHKLNEASNLGFTTAIIPKTNIKASNIATEQITSLNDLIKLLE